MCFQGVNLWEIRERAPTLLHVKVLCLAFIAMVLDMHLSHELFSSFFFISYILSLMDGGEKRPHTVTSNTPNKPSEKRHCELEVEPEERLARGTLAFQGKGNPLQKVIESFFSYS